MKIVHIVNCLRGGGIQNFLLSLLPEQVKQGNEVRLVVIEEYDYDYCKHLESILVENRVGVICLNKKRHDKKSMVKTVFDCRRIVWTVKPAIVNTHGEMSHIYGAIAVMWTNIKQIATIHNAPERWPKSCRLLCAHKPLIFCSQSAFDLRTQKNKTVITIENGISPEIVQSKSIINLKSKLSLAPSDKIIVLVGSMRPQKNYEFLKKIVDAANDATLHFCICGGNYGNGYVSADVFKGYEKNIHLLGLRSDVSAIENGADLFLSCALFEGLPIAVLEAYFNGIPCVLSPIPQHMNIADVEEVWIPDEFEPEAFVKSIYKALETKESHKAIYEQRIHQIEKYTISGTSQKYIAFYKKIIEA